MEEQKVNEKKMFVAEDVLKNYSYGLIALLADNKEEAIRLIMKELHNYGFIVNCGTNYCLNEFCLEHRVREVKDGEIIMIEGGD